MGRKKEFNTCPECYGRGETYSGDEYTGEREPCWTCNQEDKTTPEMARLRKLDGR